MGSLNWKISALGFGCMRLPVRGKVLYNVINKKEAIKIIRSGIDHS